jgi:hypothetical protein
MLRPSSALLFALCAAPIACASSTGTTPTTADAGPGDAAADGPIRPDVDIPARFANVLSLPTGNPPLDVWAEQRDGSWSRVEPGLTHTEISDYKTLPNIGPRRDQIHIRFMRQNATAEETRDAPFVDATFPAGDPGTYVVYADFSVESPGPADVPSIPKVLFVREKGMPIAGRDDGPLVQAAAVGAYGALRSRDFRIGLKIGDARTCLEPTDALRQGHAVAVDAAYLRFTLHAASDTSCATPIGAGFDRTFADREQRLVLAWGTAADNAGVRVSNPAR